MIAKPIPQDDFLRILQENRHNTVTQRGILNEHLRRGGRPPATGPRMSIEEILDELRLIRRDFHR